MCSKGIRSDSDRFGGFNTLASARAFLSSMHEDLCCGGADFVRIFENVALSYSEFPELELEYPRKKLIAELLSYSKDVADEAAVPLLMFCSALDSSSLSAATLLLERMARSAPAEAITEIVRILARNHDLTWDAVIPALEQLRRNGQLKGTAALLGEAMSAIGLSQRSWLPIMSVGSAGERVDGAIRSKCGNRGHVIYGPYLRLPAGEYHVRIRMNIEGLRRPWFRRESVATIEAVTGQGPTILAQRIIYRGSEETNYDFSFVVPDASASSIEVRVWTTGSAALTIRSVTVDQISAERVSHRLGDIIEGLVFDGSDHGGVDPSTFFKIAWSARRRLRVSAPPETDGFRGAALMAMADRFSATRSSPPRPWPAPPQRRVAWPTGWIPYRAFLLQWLADLNRYTSRLPSLSMDQWVFGCGAPTDWLPAMKIGNAGERIDQALRSKPGKVGQLAFSPYVALLPGDYLVRVRMDVGRQPLAWRYRHPCVVTYDAVSNAGEILTRRRVWLWNCLRSEFNFSFVVAEGQSRLLYGLRVWTHGVAPLTISSIVVTPNSI